MSGLTNDPYLRIALRMMKAWTPLVSHQRDSATIYPSYLTQCVQGWDRKHLVRIGHMQPRPRRHILVPQPHLSHEAIPHTKHYDKSKEIQQMSTLLGSISRWLDDMLSTSFSSRIINYEPPRGFLVPKFSAYDGSSDPFDHIMHYRQLMTLDIGTMCYCARCSLPASKANPHGFIDSLWILLIASGIYQKPLWDNTYAPRDINRILVPCKT